MTTLNTPTTIAKGSAALQEIGSELDELLEHVGAPVTARRPWIDLWVETYRTWQPWCLTVRSPDTGRLDAAALLATRTRFGITDIVGLGHGPSDYLRLPARDLAAAEQLGSLVADGLRRRPGRWRLVIDQLP